MICWAQEIVDSGGFGCIGKRSKGAFLLEGSGEGVLEQGFLVNGRKRGCPHRRTTTTPRRLQLFR